MGFQVSLGVQLGGPPWERTGRTATAATGKVNGSGKRAIGSIFEGER